MLAAEPGLNESPNDLLKSKTSARVEGRNARRSPHPSTQRAVALGSDLQPVPPTQEGAWPMLLAAQYTVVDQTQSRLRSPYSGPESAPGWRH
jgi:hypothetical protein